MTGTLTLPAGTSPRFSSGNRSSVAGTPRFDRKISFPGRKNCKAAMHAVTEAPPPVDTRRPASLYEVLRVKRNASPTEIKTAYRSLAKIYHPDASQSESDGRCFKEIHNAYAMLSDPSARALYDLSLTARLGRRPFGYSRVGYRSGFCPTRRWETDQCW